MNCDSCDEPKNSRTAATAGLALIRSFGMTVDTSTRAHALLDRALHAQQPDAILVLEQLADRADAAVGEVVDVVDLALAVLEVHQLLDDREDVFLAQRRDRVLGVEAKAHVELDPADRGQVVALGIEEQAVEQSVGGLARRRLAGAHDAVDVGQRAVAVLALVGLERVADPRAGVDVIDVEQLELVGLGLVELLRGSRASPRRRPRCRSRRSSR